MSEQLVYEQARPWSRDRRITSARAQVVIGELDGPVGHALANLIGDQVKGHSRVFAILSSDVQVRPATVMVRTVTLLPSGSGVRL